MRLGLRRVRADLWAGLLCLLLCAGAAYGQLFQQPAVVATRGVAGTVWATNFQFGDLNGDGQQDLVYDYTDQGYFFNNILFGKGDGTFVPVSGAEFNGYAYVGCIGKYNRANGRGTINIQSDGFAPGVGAVTVYPYPAIATGGSAIVSVVASIGTKTGRFSQIVSYDLDGDGVDDLIIGDSANGVILTALNDGTGHYTRTGAYVLPGNAAVGSIVTGDFNHDGKSDFAVLDTANHVVLPFYGKGDGTFTAGAALTLSGGVYSVLSATVQNGGAIVSGPGLDLLVEGAGGALSVFFGSSAGLASAAVPIVGAQNGLLGQGGHLVGVADMNGDGVLDLVTATPVGISVLLGHAPLTNHLPQAPSYTLQGIYDAGPGHTSYAVADFNGDGRPDVAVDGPEGVVLLFGNADGSLQSARSFAAGQPAMSGTLGALTGSGHVDAVVATGATQAQVLTGAGDGTFAALASGGTVMPTNAANGAPGLWSTVQAGDFNGDGKLDLVLTADGPSALLPPSGTGVSGVSLQVGLGNGTFAPPVSAVYASAHCQNSPASLYGRSFVAQIEGGISLINRDSDSGQAFHGTAASPYLAEFDSRADNACPNLHAHDLITAGAIEGNGAMQIVEQTDGHIYVYGFGTFQYDDLSVDGSLTTPGQLVAPELSSAFGGVSSTLGFPAFVGSMVVADLDGDGYGDLLVDYDNMAADHTAPTAANPNYLYIWYGSGGGKFLTSARHPVNPVRLALSRNYYQVTVADVNADSIPDLLLSDGYLLSVQLGVGDGTFGAEQHYLAGQGINSISVADLRGKGVQDLVIANGGAVLTNPVANGGTLAANTEVNTGGITVLLHKLTPQSSTVVTGTVAASPEPSIYAQPFTLNATIVQPAGQIAPGGTVAFSIDGTAVGSAPVMNGAASFPVTTVAILANTSSPLIFVDGVHTLTAVYSGDANYSGLTVTGSHTVQGQPTVSTFSGLDQTIYYGQEIGYDYGVDAIFGAAAADPTESYNSLNGGIISVYVNGVLACSDSFGVGGRCPDPPFEGFSVGVVDNYVTYAGNAYYAPSMSIHYAVTIIPDYTGTTIASSANPSFEFQPLLLSANVTAFYQPIDPTATTPIPVGFVQFFDGTTPLGLASPVNAQGTATASVATLLIGTHSITACYQVSLNFRASCSPVLTQVITLPTAAEGTVTLLTSSANPSVVGQAVTFAAVVETTGAIVQTPAGTVNFYDGATLLGTATLVAGRANFTTSALALGTHPITAMYAGNAVTAASTSAVLQQLVLVALPPASGYLLVVDPTSISVGVGDSVTVNVSIVVGSNAGGQPFLLGCSQLPNEATCAFGASSLPAGGGSTTLKIAAAAPHTCGTTTPYFVATGRRRMLPWLGLAGFGLLFMRRRPKKLRGLLLGLLVVASLVGSAAMSGCGGPCTDLGTQPFDYSFFVTATEQGAPAGTAYATETQAMQMHVHL